MNARAPFLWDAPLELEGAQAHVLTEAVDLLFAPIDSVQRLADKLGVLTPEQAAEHLRAVAIALNPDAIGEALHQDLKDLAFEIGCCA